MIVTLANPEIDYLNVTNRQTTPPTQQTISALTSTSTPPATLSISTVTISLTNPLVVSTGNVIGLGFEFDIRKSFTLDMNGQITGVVNPTINVNAITPSDADAYIDEFIAGVTTFNPTGNSFAVQGPHGHAFTSNMERSTGCEQQQDDQ